MILSELGHLQQIYTIAALLVLTQGRRRILLVIAPVNNQEVRGGVGVVGWLLLATDKTKHNLPQSTRTACDSS